MLKWSLKIVSSSDYCQKLVRKSVDLDNSEFILYSETVEIYYIFMKVSVVESRRRGTCAVDVPYTTLADV